MHPAIIATADTLPVRFAGVLDHSACPRLPFDTVLFEESGCVVAPTLGSIVPNWLLVIPRTRVINFSVWQRQTGIPADALMRQVMVRKSIDPKQALWFEHGPSLSGSTLGCGVDHAHLHVIADPPFSPDAFLSDVVKMPFGWEDISLDAAYGTIEPNDSYLLATYDDRTVIARNARNVPSQFFRRAVAKFAGLAEGWDYRTFPYAANARSTVHRFGEGCQSGS